MRISWCDAQIGTYVGTCSLEAYQKLFIDPLELQYSNSVLFSRSGLRTRTVWSTFEPFPYPRGDSMIFKISWAADLSRSETVWFRSGMVPSCHINYQKFGEFMFGKIITKKLIFTSNSSSVLFRHTRSRQTFDTWFHNLGPPFIETT